MVPRRTISNYQKMFASQHNVGSPTQPYQPFHSNNMDFAIGGPIIPHHNSFFYFAVEPLRSSQGAGSSVTFAAPEFIQFAQTNNPGTVGTGLLTNYQPVGVSGAAVSQTAQAVFGKDAMVITFVERPRSRTFLAPHP